MITFYLHGCVCRSCDAVAFKTSQSIHATCTSDSGSFSVLVEKVSHTILLLAHIEIAGAFRTVTYMYVVKHKN